MDWFGYIIVTISCFMLIAMIHFMSRQKWMLPLLVISPGAFGLWLLASTYIFIEWLLLDVDKSSWSGVEVFVFSPSLLSLVIAFSGMLLMFIFYVERRIERINKD